MDMVLLIFRFGVIAMSSFFASGQASAVVLSSFFGKKELSLSSFSEDEHCLHIENDVHLCSLPGN